MESPSAQPKPNIWLAKPFSQVIAQQNSNTEKQKKEDTWKTVSKKNNSHPQPKSSPTPNQNPTKKKKKKKKKEKPKLQPVQTPPNRKALELHDFVSAKFEGEAYVKSYTFKPVSVSAVKRVGGSQSLMMTLFNEAPKLGKQREVPRAKKYTKLKKLILQQRKQKFMDFVKENLQSPKTLKSVGLTPEKALQLLQQIDPSEDQLSPKDESPKSEVIEPPSREILDQIRDVVPKIPAKLSIIDQVITPEINETATEVMSTLFKFYLKQKQTQPLKAKRRLVTGFREVLRAVEGKKVKGIIMAPNVDSVGGPGGIDETVSTLLKQARSQNFPVIFALSRAGIGKALQKRTKISVVGIVSTDGAHQLFEKLVSLSKDAKKSFQKQKEEEKKKLEEKLKKEEEEIKRKAEEQLKKALNPTATVYVPQKIVSKPLTLNPKAASFVPSFVNKS